MSTFKFLSYSEWIEQNPEAKLSEEKCPDCLGSGFSDFPHCGQTMVCESCEGEGTINSAREEYDRQLEHDKKIVDRYSKFVEAANVG